MPGGGSRRSWGMSCSLAPGLTSRQGGCLSVGMPWGTGGWLQQTPDLQDL